jgi:hypothetical protein
MNLAQLYENYKEIYENVEKKGPEILADNFKSVWNTQGRNIGSNWNGNSLVKTGTLESIMTSPRSFAFDGNSFEVAIPQKYLFLNERYRFLGISRENLNKISALFGGK